MSRTFIWAMVFLLGSIALLLIFAMPKTSAGSFTGFSASDYKPMNDFIDRFNKQMADKGADKGLFPSAEIPAKELSWLTFDDNKDVKLKAIKGLRFADKEALIIFCIDPSGRDVSTDVIRDMTQNQKYLGSINIESDIKYIVVSNNENDGIFIKDDYKNVINDIVKSAIIEGY